MTIAAPSLSLSPDLAEQVVSYVRSETPGVWLNTSAYSLAGSLSVLKQSVALANIYQKSQFNEPRSQSDSPAA